MQGEKPKLEERGPYVYKAVYIKDTEEVTAAKDRFFRFFDFAMRGLLYK